MINKHKLRTIIGAAILVEALIATGCAPKSPGSETAADHSGKPLAVHLAYFPNVTHAAALVGVGDGSFEKALAKDATLETRTFTAGPAEIEALFAGEVDLGYIGPGPAVNGFLKSKGDALVIIAGASSGGTALVRRADVAIAGVKDLAGKRVAVPQTGGTQDISLRHFLKAAGLASKDKGGTVDVVDFAPADTLNLFQQKQLDAAWVPEPWVTRLEKEAGGKVVLEEKSLWPGGKFATTVVIARAAFLKEHPQIVQHFLEAHVAVVDRINADPSAAQSIINTQLKKLTTKSLKDDTLKQALARTTITSDPLPDTVLTLADWSRDLGYQRENRDALKKLFDTHLINAIVTKQRKP